MMMSEVWAKKLGNKPTTSERREDGNFVTPDGRGERVLVWLVIRLLWAATLDAVCANTHCIGNQ
jgi:hypothetical protein